MKSKSVVSLALLLVFAAAGKASSGWIDGGVPVCGAAREQRNPRAVSDGAGGAIIVWEDHRGSFSWDLYAQRISSTGDTLWDLNGVPVCTASLDQIDARLVSDGSGGAFIAWTDYRNGTNNRDVYMQRLSSQGDPLWTVDGVAVCAEPGHQYASEIAADDSSGVIAAWLDSGPGLYAQRLSGNGVALWDSVGVVISGGINARLQILEDGSGGAIIVWEDSGPASNLYAQRISRSGIVQWKVNGITVCGAGGNQSLPQLVSDSAGGAIITWMDFRSFAWNIFAQRISGAGGCIIAWVDNRNGELDVYARRVTGGGVPLWPADGIPVCTAPFAQQEVEMVPDSAGGAIIAWADQRALGIGDIYAQRMSSDGAPLWTLGGEAVCAATGEQTEPRIVADGYGGAIAAWRDARVGSADIYAQRIRFNGAITAVEENRVPAIRAELLPFAPNPFSGELHVGFIVDSPGGAAVRVFDVNGRLVRDLGRSRSPAGMQSLIWDCRDRSGCRVRSGIYFIRLETAAGTIARKAVMLD